MSRSGPAESRDATIDAATGPAAGGFRGLLDFLDRLERSHVFYRLLHTRDSVTVDIALPGWRWEVEFMADGSVEFERYKSVAGVESDIAALETIFQDLD